MERIVVIGCSSGGNRAWVQYGTEVVRKQPWRHVYVAE